jgi:protein TonB
MERPSHIDFDTQARCFSCRLPMIGLALSLQLAGVWLITHGLMSRVMHFVPGIIEVVKIPDVVKQPDKPPEPNIPTHIKNDPIPEPFFDKAPPIDRNPFTPQPPTASEPPAKGIDRALASIAGTHTVPPYPPIARRIGVEGKVSLRLTVSAEGRVIAAEVVSSSGRDDMDQTAQQWIMAHWAYKPALDNGVPVISHVLASVNFSLINQR